MRNLSHTLYVCLHCIPDVTGTVMTGNDLITDLSILEEFHVMGIMSCNLEIRTLKHLGLRLLSALLLPFIVEKNHFDCI